MRIYFSKNPISINQIPHDVIFSIEPNTSPYDIKGSAFTPQFIITDVDVFNPSDSVQAVNLKIDDIFNYIIPIGTDKGFTNSVINSIRYTGPTSEVIISIMGISYNTLNVYGVFV